MHRPRRSALLALALVLALHAALVLLLWRERPVPRGGPPAPSRPPVLWVREVPAMAPQTSARVAREPLPPAPRKPRRTPAAPDAATSPAPALASITAPPMPAASAASAAEPSLLDTDATRRAIREAARMPSTRERAAAASEERAALTPDQRLGRGIEQAAVGDCLKGEYAGGGMGLLSLPFWLVAEARGKCRK
jgi:hypothetical protein